jgi:predicted permease
MDLRLLCVALLASVGAGVLSGIAPAVQAGRGSLISSLRERAGTGFGGVRLRKAIVTAQIAFTLILVIGAALFVRTLNGLMAKGPGFATSSLISFGLDPDRNGYTKPEASRLIRRVYADLRASNTTRTSGVARVQLLTGGSWSDPVTIQTNQRSTTDRDVNLNAVSPGFFSTLGARIVAGRDFDERDSRPVGETGFRAAIVNQGFVKRYLGDRSPLGVRICEGWGPDAKPDIEIVGVVADFSYRGIREDREQAYFPIFEGSDTGGSFYVRASGTPETAFREIRAMIQREDPGLPVTYFRTLEEQVNRSLNTERMLATLLGGFGMLALLLSLVGLYGVMSFAVTQRTREVGIRLALGATRGGAIRLVLRDAVVMIGGGVAIALPCARALGRLVESQLFGVQPTDPTAIIAATLLLTTAALGAAFIPAYRASRVNPADALRFD